MRTRGPDSTARPHYKTAAIAAAVADALLIGAASAALALRPEAAPAAPPGPVLQFSPQEVTTPRIGPVARTLAFSGPLVAPATAVVKAHVAATLLELRVNEGARVRANEVLGRLDLAELRTQIDHRSASVALAQATLDEAKTHHTANESLAERRFISSTALHTSRGKLEVAEAQLDAARAQLATVRVSERQAALVAPIPGIIAKRHAVPGEKLAEHQTVFTIVDLSTLELAGTVPAHEASALRVDQPVTLAVDGAGASVRGRIDRIAPQAEPGTRAIGVTVVLDNADERYRAGQYAEARLEIADPQPRMTLPATAVGRSSGQDYVWVIDKGNLVRRLIVTGPDQGPAGRVVVLRGVAPDAQVLAVRFDNLKEGAAAQVAAAATPAPPAAP